MEKNYIKKKYLENLEQLRGMNPFAYQFLKKLEQHVPSLWLSTDKNVHLYVGRKFIAYIKFTLDSTGIILSSQYNKKIWSGTEDYSALLFQDQIPTIIEQYNDSQSWASWFKQNYDGIEIIISKNAPETFFHQLYNAILTIILNERSNVITPPQNSNTANYWWFGINNVKKRNNVKAHVIYSDIAPFLSGQTEEFLWPYGGSPRSQKYYAQMKIGDSILFWMGDGIYQKNWGILGFGLICSIETHNDFKQNQYILQRSHLLEFSLTPYPSQHPQETKETEFLKNIFGIEFPPLSKMFKRLGYRQNIDIITIEKIQREQYEAVLFRTLSFKKDTSYEIQKDSSDIEKQIQRSRTLSRSERLQRLQNAPKKPESCQAIQTIFKRNPDVIAEVLERANGFCEACGNPAPFIRASNGTPYLEVHHKKQLAQDGEDTVENAIALCPNCHRKAHFGILTID